MLTPSTLFAASLAAAAVLGYFAGRATGPGFCTAACALYSALAVTAWYTSGLPSWVNWLCASVNGGAAAFWAHRARARQRPGWWGGAHERIEQA